MRSTVQKRWRSTWLLGLGGALALAASVAQASGCVRSVRWNDDPPYSARDASGAVRGIYADLVQEALRRMGCEPNFIKMPWARALHELEQGRLDILPGALWTEQRDAFAYFSRPVNRSPNVLFVTKSAMKRYRIGRLDDLANSDFRLGAQIKVSYGAQFEALLKSPEFAARLVPVSERMGAWKMMEVGRIDGLIADEITGLAEIRQLSLVDEIVRSNVVVSGDASMVAFSKQSISAGFVARFNRALEAMMADGAYKTIKERYVPCTASVETLGCK